METKIKEWNCWNYFYTIQNWFNTQLEKGNIYYSFYARRLRARWSNKPEFKIICRKMWQKSEILKSKFWSTLKIILLKMFFFVVKNRHFRQKFGLLAKILDI